MWENVLLFSRGALFIYLFDEMTYSVPRFWNSTNRGTVFFFTKLSEFTSQFFCVYNIMMLRGELHSFITHAWSDVMSVVIRHELFLSLIVVSPVSGSRQEQVLNAGLSGVEREDWNEAMTRIVSISFSSYCIFSSNNSLGNAGLTY